MINMMKRIRKPAVAGTFYDSDKDRLETLIVNYLSASESCQDSTKDVIGIITPHAGYVFSGQCAACSFQAISHKQFDLAVVIAPCHRYGGFNYSVGAYESYETPLGNIQVDTESVEYLMTDNKFSFIPEAHESEHSLEVQLPFLQVINSKARILPLLIGAQHDQSSLYLAEKLAEMFTDKVDKTVFIISTDLSHYHNALQAEQLDRKVSDSIERFDVNTLWNLVKNYHAEACGIGGILTMLYLSKILGYNQATKLNYTHSGIISRDNQHVVGYLSSVFYR